MNIQTVAENLKNTIAGKEKMLASQHELLPFTSMGEGLAVGATIQFLEINIAELKRILADVEQCLPVESALYDSTRTNWIEP